MLYFLRKALITEARNVAKESVIFSIAETLLTTFPDAFNAEKFQINWQNGSGTDASGMIWLGRDS